MLLSTVSTQARSRDGVTAVSQLLQTIRTTHCQDESGMSVCLRVLNAGKGAPIHPSERPDSPRGAPGARYQPPQLL